MLRTLAWIQRKFFLEVSAILFREVSLVSEEIRFQVDRVPGAQSYTITTVDALVGINVDLRYGFIWGCGAMAAVAHSVTQTKSLDTCVGYDVSHDEDAP